MAPRRLAASLLMLAALPVGAEGRLDSTFGDAGFAVQGFQPAPHGGSGAGNDQALAACSGPLGTLVVTGFASEGTRVVTVWLTPQGELDTRFSDDGKASFDLPPGNKGTAVALCQPDGKPVIAYNYSIGALDLGSTLRIVRVDTQTGQPDAGFANGTLVIDLSDTDPTAVTQVPMSLSMGLGGDLLLMGSYGTYRPGNRGPVLVRDIRYGFIARIPATGTDAQVASSNQVAVSITSYVAAGVGADGKLRAFGTALDDAGAPSRLARSLMDYDSLQITESGSWLGSNDTFRPWSGRMLDGDTMALAVVRNDSEPAVLIAEPDFGSWRLLPLPRPQLDGQPALTGVMQLSPLGTDALVVASAVGLPDQYPRAMHVVKLRGSEHGDPQLDPGFGVAGRTLVRYPVASNCDTPEFLAFARFTFWNGAIAAATTVNRSCHPGLELDYAAVKLEARLFGDDFEQRYPVR